MSIRRIRTLIAVAEQGSFGLAAEAVAISQAAVSLQMKSLEDELNVVLFDRSKRPPALNAEGLELVERARETIVVYDLMMNAIPSDKIYNGELSIGAMPTTMTGVIPKVVSALRSIYPELRVHLVPNHAREQIPELERGQLDTVIVTQPPRIPDHLIYRPFAVEPLILLAPPDSPDGSVRELLKKFPFIRLPRDQWVGQLIDDWLRKQSIKVNDLMELDTIESISNMVYFNLGVTIVPAPCVLPPNPLPLKRITLGLNPPERVLGLLTRRDSSKTRLVDVLYEQLVELVETEQQNFDE
ncbi:MAG: hypothetical protein CBB68_05840 [Rhodospirillaceae bacterium TMED8]|nr:LysR family transcriptional regulator [Magnetovibrio sp.]OUT51148.1 MAG: hypothetical protein CBB68_05840 [Rhodospirillaceae bacterium TMED8]|tara:strand:+ start:171 stop:1064 length:894 start_codon:yes stop_codon:yes gene_type:complete